MHCTEFVSSHTQRSSLEMTKSKTSVVCSGWSCLCPVEEKNRQHWMFEHFFRSSNSAYKVQHAGQHGVSSIRFENAGNQPLREHNYVDKANCLKKDIKAGPNEQIIICDNQWRDQRTRDFEPSINALILHDRCKEACVISKNYLSWNALQSSQSKTSPEWRACLAGWLINSPVELLVIEKPFDF